MDMDVDVNVDVNATATTIKFAFVWILLLLLLLPRVKYHGIGNIYHCVPVAATTTTTTIIATTATTADVFAKQTTHNKTKALIISYEILMDFKSESESELKLDLELESESQLLAGHAIGQEAAAAAAKLITGLPAEWPKRKCLNLMT